MRKHIKIMFKVVKEHPLLFGIICVIGAALGFLVPLLIKRIIKDITNGMQQGSITSLNIIALVGTIAGLISLSWQIWDRNKNKPDINLSLELIEKEGIPEKITIKAINYGKTTEINRAGFILSDNNLAFYHEFTGLLPNRVKSGGIPYTHDFEIKDIVKVLKEKSLSLKFAFIENDNNKRFTYKIPSDFIDKVETIKLKAMVDS